MKLDTIYFDAIQKELIHLVLNALVFCDSSSNSYKELNHLSIFFNLYLSIFIYIYLYLSIFIYIYLYLSIFIYIYL
jgi:hypothetical protein